MPGTVQDPRMNPGREREYGIAYFPNDFEIGEGENVEIHIAGHYFYRKDTGNPNDEFNPRFLPQGFPILARQATGGPMPGQDVIDYYRAMFPNLIYNIILRIEANPEYTADPGHPTQGLDSLLPMVALMNRCITSTSGLPGIVAGNLYSYNRDNTTAIVGKVE